MNSRLILILVLLTGCAGGRDVPELNQYLLRTDAEPVQADSGTADVGLGTVSVAPYLDQPGLVVETSTGGVREARYHQWAEPLRSSLRSFLADEIGTRNGTPVRYQGYRGNAWKNDVEFLVSVHVDQLHGTADGDAVLVANWAITARASDGASAEHSFRGTEALERDGYSALIAAEKRLLERLASEIAESLP
jgi:uncharacterized lipoprotein YmbA